MSAVVYVHGKNGSASEAAHYRPLFLGFDVVGLAYEDPTPREAAAQIHDAVTRLASGSGRVQVIANSIGAYYAMTADIASAVACAYFISPIVDLEALITERMREAGVTEAELQEKGVLPTAYGDPLSWEYLSYVRQHPVRWTVPTHILRGSRDDLTTEEAIAAFAREHRASLTVLEGGEHWFHTAEQMLFLDAWIRAKQSPKERL